VNYFTLRIIITLMETITECYISVGQVPVYLVRMLQRTLPAGFIAAVPSNAH